MGECGCTMNDNRYRLAGPGGTFYVVTLSGNCLDCDSSTGITIEHITPSHPLWEEYGRGGYIDGPLPLEKWADGKGVAIVCGMRKHEFVKATLNHLVGIKSQDFGGKAIDRVGAETILEEMFDDAQMKPAIVRPMAAAPAGGTP